VVVNSSAGKKRKLHGTKTRVPEIYPGRAIAGRRFEPPQSSRGLGTTLRGRRFRTEPGKSPARPSLACWHTLTLSAGRASRFACRLNRLELVLRPTQCAVSTSRAKAFGILPREEVTMGD